MSALREDHHDIDLARLRPVHCARLPVEQGAPKALNAPATPPSLWLHRSALSVAPSTARQTRPESSGLLDDTGHRSAPVDTSKGDMSAGPMHVQTASALAVGTGAGRFAR